MVFGLALTVRADNTASSIQIYASVDEDGKADVTMTIRLRIDQALDVLCFPLPLNAEDIRLNDGGATTTKGINSTQVKLPSSVYSHVGDHVLSFKYKIPNVVNMVEDPNTKKNNLTLELPLLSDFEFPVQSVTLAVTLPENIEGRPVFKSTYYQGDIDMLLSVTINSNMITGQITQQLKDRETLQMELMVDETLFPPSPRPVWTAGTDDFAMIVLAVLAVVYWFAFLRCLPVLRKKRANAPDSISAGELGSVMVMQGADLTMMVVSWAQLGYILIQLDNNGRVLLHKRMEMGNERSAFEVRSFNTLFGKRRIIDGTGYQYARLCRKVASTVPGKKNLCKKGYGNAKIFRIIAAISHGICGICLAMNLTVVPALQVVLSMLLFVLCTLSGWLIQSGMYRIHLRHKLLLWLSFALCLIWTLVGVWAGIWYIPLCSVLAQLLFGLMAAYGGRRTDTGRLNASYILGLRKYLWNLSEEEVQRLQRNDPDFFYNMIPYAMALGIDKRFAKVFGRKKLEPCPYFVCGIHNKMNAADCNRFLHEAMEILDFRQRRMLIDNLLSTHMNFR